MRNISLTGMFKTSWQNKNNGSFVLLTSIWVHHKYKKPFGIQVCIKVYKFMCIHRFSYCKRHSSWIGGVELIHTSRVQEKKNLLYQSTWLKYFGIFYDAAFLLLVLLLKDYNNIFNTKFYNENFVIKISNNNFKTTLMIRILSSQKERFCSYILPIGMYFYCIF